MTTSTLRTSAESEAAGTDTAAGPLLHLLIRRRRLVLMVALLLMVGPGWSAVAPARKLTPGAYLDASAESQRAAERLTPECRVHGMILVLAATGCLP